MPDPSRPTYRRLAQEHADTADFLREIVASVDGGLGGRVRFRILRRADRLSHLAAQALANGEAPPK